MKRFEDGRRLCFALILSFFADGAWAQSIDISKFYYRDYLDFGQNRGVFGSANSSANLNLGENLSSNSGLNSTNSNGNNVNLNSGSNLNANSNGNSSGSNSSISNSSSNSLNSGILNKNSSGVNSNILNSNSGTNSANSSGTNSNATTLTAKNGTSISVPNTPNFYASSNYGSLTSVGRGFVATANHVTSPESIANLRKFGLTNYTIAKELLVYENGVSVKIDSVSTPYGWDTKFMRFDKYLVEGSVDLLSVENTTAKGEGEKESVNLASFKAALESLKDGDGNIYLYQAGSGDITLFGTSNPQGKMYAKDSGETRGGGFGTLVGEAINYGDEVNCEDECGRGISFNYKPNLTFRNVVTEGDSGSGIYAYDSAAQKWILLGVTSKTFVQIGGDEGKISFVSGKDFEDYKSKFEQKIALNEQNTMTNQSVNSITLQDNKDIIFSGGGTIEVGANIYRNANGYAGGFVFEAASGASAASPTIYKFTNSTATTHIFKGSGLDIGENVEVQWALRNESNDSLHKIGLGTLRVQTAYTPSASENLGYLKVGQGKVILDTDKKAYEGIYFTSGRGSLELVQGKAEGLGASKNTTASVENSVNSYMLAQNSANEMGFYFGTGGGKLDLAGNSLTLNTIAANDSKAIITNTHSDLANLEIQGFGYNFNNGGAKTATKANTIIHASFGENSQNSAANLNLIYKSDTKNDSASLIFDGNININGALNATNSSVVLQGHPTTHATISDTDIASKVQAAENGTSGAASLDLSRPSTLAQSDWDSRNFAFANGINLTNANLSVGKAAILNADITADKDSQITFGGVHFIDKKDGANIGGSGFYYAQEIENGELTNENYESSEFSGKITADGAKITSNFVNFAPNLELKNGATLTAKNFTLNSTNTLNFKGGSTAKVENLIFKGFTNSDISSKFTLDDNSKFEVEKSLIFDSSTFNLDTLKNSTSTLKLPANYDFYAYNGSKITVSDFKNKNANAKFSLNNSTFSADSLNFSNSASISLANNATLTLKNDLTASNLDLTLANSIFNGSILTSDSLTLNLTGTSTFTAATLTASGSVSLNADTNSNIKLTTLNLNSATLDSLSQNVSIETLNLSESSVDLDKFSAQMPKNIDLKTNSTLRLSELNLNSNTIKFTSDAISKAHITRLLYDASKSANMENVNQSKIVAQNLELINVGQKLVSKNDLNGDLTNDFFVFDLSKTLTLQSNAKISVNFVQNLADDTSKIKLNDYYTIFTAQDMKAESVSVEFSQLNSTLFTEGRVDNNTLFVRFRQDDPRNSAELSTHINPALSPFLEILLQHDKNDESITNAVNLGAYAALQNRLASLEKSLESLAHSGEKVLQALPLLHRQEINARITQNRLGKFTLNGLSGTKLAYNSALNRLANPTSRSDIAPRLALWNEKERANRVWSNVGAGYFAQNADKLSLYSVSLGYDRRFLGDELLVGGLISLTNADFRAEKLTQSPKIYTIALYSDAILGFGELQNELSGSFISGDMSFEDENADYKGFGAFFDSIYKLNLGSLPIKPKALVRVALQGQNELKSPNYKQKAYQDVSVELGLGLEWLYERKSGFYAASFLACRDVYHSEPSAAVSLANAQDFIVYKRAEPSFAYELHLWGLDNFSNGLFLRYGVGAFLATRVYKGVKADLQLGYRF